MINPKNLEGIDKRTYYILWGTLGLIGIILIIFNKQLDVSHMNMFQQVVLLAGIIILPPIIALSYNFCAQFYAKGKQ